MKLSYLLTGVALMACAAPSMAQDANVEGRVVKLEKEMKAVQRKVFPEGAGKYFEPEITPGEKPKTDASPAPSAVSDLIGRIDALETQLATLTGQVEQQAANAKSMDTRLKGLEAQVTALKNRDEQVPEPKITPAVQPVTPKPAVTTAKSTAAKPATPTKASAARTNAVSAIEKPATGDAFEDGYNYGYRLWESKFNPEAQVQLEEVVKKHPKHKRISYARNLLGRAWLDDGKPATAVKIFYDNYKLDPRGDRAPESLYFLGQALTDLGKNTEACQAFGELASAYPDAATGRLSDRLSKGRTRAKCK